MKLITVQNVFDNTDFKSIIGNFIARDFFILLVWNMIFYINYFDSTGIK